MNNVNQRVSYLFNLYYKKQATQEELQELFELLKDSSDDDQLTDLMRNAWDDLGADDVVFDAEKSKAILSKILSTQHADNVIATIKPRRYFDWKKIAAILIVSLSIGAYFLTKTIHPFGYGLVKAAVIHDAMPGADKAILTLSNGSTIALDNKHHGVIAKQGNILVTKNTNGQVDYKVANAENDNSAIAYNTISTPKGGQYKVVLPDGSKVWLNAVSSIKFPTEFKGAERHVEITGEAYFEVAKNPAMPFIVKVNREEVRVLGTHFSIMAYSDESVLKTTLLEGSIMLSSAKSVHLLKPGNQAILNERGDVEIIKDADVEGEIAWKNGLFKFKDEDIRSIMRQAARWYDVDVSYRGKIPTRQFNGSIPRNVKLSELLNMFKYAGINFTIEGKNITVID